MGCDIHFFIETKVGDGEWQADPHHRTNDDGYVVEASAARRDYSLFSDLARVRGKGSFGLRPLGIPDDVSDTIRRAMEAWGEDGHSHSYIYMEDFIKVLKKHKHYDSENYKGENAFFSWEEIWGSGEEVPSYPAIVNYCKRLIDNYEAEKILLSQSDTPPLKVRFIFWFDN